MIYLEAIEIISWILGIVLIVVAAGVILNGADASSSGQSALQADALSNPTDGFVSYLQGIGIGALDDIIGIILLVLGLAIIYLGANNSAGSW